MGFNPLFTRQSTKDKGYSLKQFILKNWRQEFEDFFPKSLSHPATALSWKENNEWKECSYQELVSGIDAWASEFQKRNLKAGDRVALLGPSSKSWVQAFYGALKIGAVLVPLDPKLTVFELQNIIDHAEPKCLLYCESLLEFVMTLKNKVTPTTDFISLTKTNLGEASSYQTHESLPEDLAVISYTSGTTGRPKGVMIPIRSLVYQTSELIPLGQVTRDEVVLSMIPLNHMFELTCNLLLMLRVGGEVSFCSSLYPQDILGALQDRKVSRMTTVPLFLTLLKNNIQKQLDLQPRYRQMLVKAIPSRRLKKRLLHRLHALLGPRFKEFISGGAALPAETELFFKSLGIRVVQGYGMTEAGPLISFNHSHETRMFSVGQPLRGCEVKVMWDPAKIKSRRRKGEIWVRGPQVMLGYFKQPETTKEVLTEDGWLKTGDIGYLDKKGFLFITGRAKSLIVLNGGKKVHPEEVESVLSECPYIKEVCVIKVDLTSGAVRLAAIVVPEETAESNSENLKLQLEADIEVLSQKLAPYKRPEIIITQKMPFPRGTTRKIKRFEVENTYQKGAAAL